MKKLAIAVGVLAIVFIVFMFNVLRATQQGVTAAPDPLEAGRQKLHAQLVASEQRESEIEKQDWNSIPLLHDLINAHQERMGKLAGNSQAGEIVAHDRDAAARLEKRIQELTEQESQKAPAPATQAAPHD
jgi:hypothetical protein